MSEKTTLRFHTINKLYGQSLAEKFGGTFQNGVWEIEVEKGSTLESKIIQISKDNFNLTPYKKETFFDITKKGTKIQFQMPDLTSARRVAAELGCTLDGYILTLTLNGSYIIDNEKLTKIKEAGGKRIE